MGIAVMGIAVTNNPMVRDKLPRTEFHDTDYLGVLKAVRDRIHLGHKLLTHPLSGSIKPGEMPYKSVIISAGKGSLDEKSLAIVEESIQSCQKFSRTCPKRDYSAKILADFQLIDYDLIASF